MDNSNLRLLVGAHMSIAGGFEKAIERGQSLGCTTIQIFTKSNRQWRAKPITKQEADLFKKTAITLGISPVVAHATYLINLASPNAHTAQLSMQALSNELIRCEQLGIPYLVLHPGSFVQGEIEEGIARISANLNAILDKTTSKTMILLELMAGQGSVIGSSFEQLATILQQITHKKRVGVCFDTCHAFAAGYDLRTPATYKKTWADFDSIIGLEQLKVIHINDSKKELGSHVDRHEHIGKGQLGLEAFKLLFNDKRFFNIPKILETPKVTKDLSEDSMNLATIKSVLTKETKKALNVAE
jgi:deoxyribonuclease-4